MNWEPLIDPRDSAATLSISAGRNAWKHIIQDHVTREPWQILIPETLVTQLGTMDWSIIDDPASIDCISELSTFLESEVSQCLQRPLVMLYHLERKDYEDDRCLLILPSGLKLILRFDSEHRHAHLVTCYLPSNRFSSRICTPALDAEDRWKRTLSRTVQAHCEIQPGHGLVPKQSLELPQRAKQRAEIRNNIRFVDAAEWGFCESLDPIAWRGSLNPWSQPGQCTTSKSGKRSCEDEKRRRLLGRRAECSTEDVSL